MPNAVSVIPQWFRVKKGIAFGFVGIGSSIGAVVFPIAARKLIPQVGYAINHPYPSVLITKVF